MEPDKETLIAVRAAIINAILDQKKRSPVELCEAEPAMAIARAALAATPATPAATQEAVVTEQMVNVMADAYRASNPDDSEWLGPDGVLAKVYLAALAASGHGTGGAG